MNFNFGQFRSNQFKNYLTKMNYTTLLKENQSALAEDVYFKDFYIQLDNSNLFQKLDFNEREQSYYLKIGVERKRDSEQTIKIKLVNTKKTEDNKQYIETLYIPSGKGQSGIDVFEIVITPNQEYDQIEFELERTIEDYTLQNSDGTYGRTVSLEVLNISKIFNLIDFLSTTESQLTILKQIGIQSKPGLLTCINGEAIRVGRSGIYEINNGIIITFIGFIIEPEYKDLFLLDYQY